MRSARQAHVYLTPAIANGVVYLGTSGTDNGIYALNASNGALRWKYQTGGAIWGSPNVVDGTLYVGSKDSFFYALNSSDGSVRWKEQMSSAVYAYGAPTAIIDGAVYTSSQDGSIYALAASTGQLAWKVSTDGNAYGAPVVAP